MRIEIAERLHPFAHCPGMSFVLPNSQLSVQIFPALLRVRDLAHPVPQVLADVHLDLKGPLTDFTALLDLERQELRVFGESAHGYFRYILKAQGLKGMTLSVDKAPQTDISCSSSGIWTVAKTSVPPPAYSPDPLERLSLGSHQKQDWELIRRKGSWHAIFPIWYRLGQLIPTDPILGKSNGTALLLDECRCAIAAHAPEKILEKFRTLFLAGFEGVLSPRLVDADFQGLICQGQNLSSEQDLQGSPLTLLVEGAKLIRSLFLKETETAISLLPELPPEFHCGRFLHVKCGRQGVLNMEWSKKAMRRMTFAALENQKIRFLFSQKMCRLRTSYQDAGQDYYAGTELEIEAGRSYWFDCFQK